MGSRKLAYFVFFLLVPFLKYGQSNATYVDSLLKLTKIQRDTSLISTYFNLAVYYNGSDVEKAKYYSNQAKITSEKIGFTRGIINYYAFYSSILDLEGKFNEAIALNKKSAELSIDIKDEYRLACSYFNLAKSYHYSENFDSAILHYNLASKLFEKTKTDKFNSTLNMNLGVLFQEIKQNQKSLEYFRIAENSTRNNKDDHTLCMVLVNKSAVEIDLGDLKSAKMTILEAIKLAEKLNNEVFNQAGLITLCDIKLKMNDIQDILPLAEKSLSLSRKFEIAEGINKSLCAIAAYYFHNNNSSLALKYANEAWNQNLSIDYLKDKIYTSMLLSDIYLSKNDIVNYRKYRKISDSLSRVLNISDVRKQVEDIHTKYETEKKSLQIKTLEAESKNRLWISLALGLGLLGIGGVAYSQFKTYKAKKALFDLEQEKAVSDERLRIASDMHDDVGTGLSRIRYITNSIQMGETSSNEGLEKVTEISDDTITKMSEIIWALNKTNQTLEELIYFIRSQVSEMAENAKIDFVGKLPESIPELSFGWMRNRHTYLLVKETVHNAIKHAKAKTIKLEFRIDIELTIAVMDNGIGFDTSVKHKGNGLNNYRKRIEKLGGTYTLNSEINKGTTIVYRIPLV